MPPPGSTAHRTRVAPLLVVAWGNRLRGDDALGPLVLDALCAQQARAPLAGLTDPPAVEFLELHQLQIEVTADLLGRRAVLWIDADTGLTDGLRWTTLPPLATQPFAQARTDSHQLSVQALWALTARLHPGLPLSGHILHLPCRQTGLGEPPAAAQPGLLASATQAAVQWLHDQAGRSA